MSATNTQAGLTRIPNLNDYFPHGLTPFDGSAAVWPIPRYAQSDINDLVTSALPFVEVWIASLPFTQEAKSLLTRYAKNIALDWAERTYALNQEVKNSDLFRFGQYDWIYTPVSIGDYLSRIDVDALLYSLSPQVYYENAIQGLTGLTAEERQRLASYVEQIASQYGRQAPLGRELLLSLDPQYAMETYLAQSDMTAEEQARLSRLFPRLLSESREAGQQFWAWLNQHPARQMLVTYDPEYAFDQFLANANLRDNERQSLRRYFDVALAQWRAQGSPGSFHTWLGAQAGQTPSSQQQFLEGLDPAYAYQGWMARQTGAMSEEGRRRVEQSYDRLYNYFRDRGDQAPATFRDFLKNYQPGDVALGQAPAPLRDLVGRTRWLGY